MIEGTAYLCTLCRHIVMGACVTSTVVNVAMVTIMVVVAVMVLAEVQVQVQVLVLGGASAYVMQV